MDLARLGSTSVELFNQIIRMYYTLRIIKKIINERVELTQSEYETIFINSAILVMAVV